MGQKILDMAEISEMEQIELRNLQIDEMLIENVKKICTAQHFKKLMSENFPENMLHDIATRLMQKFIGQRQKGIDKPVPNLGQYMPHGKVMKGYRTQE